MKLKTYQTQALNTVSRYFSAALNQGAEKAFDKFNSHTAYKIPDENLADLPYVCVRIPTGGGKTLLAAHSILRIAERYLQCDYPVTLWLVPTKTIKDQTAEALKNPQHPYRAALDKAFNREVKVITAEEFTLLRPQDFGAKAIVVVSTIQNFRVDNKDGRKIYASNEHLSPHFERLSPEITSNLSKITIDDIQENGLDAKQAGKIKRSFANLLKAFKPLIIVDEAHNARTALTFDVFSALSPSAILEFTATPSTDRKSGSNVLYHVAASTLKAEEMIKLPIVLTEHPSWQQAVDNAVIERGRLADKAQFEQEYLRPLVLFQAEPKNGKVTVGVLKQYLIDELKIDESEIAIVTGTQHELDQINLLDPRCAINYIITVEALKEGWDCPFAYVFCSVQNVGSSKEAEQLLGRVLRMPYAKKRTIADLNRAYAHLSSNTFGETARHLTDKLIGMGFEALEVAEMLQQKQQASLTLEEIPLFQQPTTPSTVLELPKMLDTNSLSENEKAQLVITTKDDKVMVEVSGAVSENLEKILLKTTSGKAQQQLSNQIAIHQAKVERYLSPAEKGEQFAPIPQLCVAVQGELELAEPQLLLDYQRWNLAEYSAQLDFRINQENATFEVDVDDKTAFYKLNTQSQLTFNDDWLDMTENDFIRWLDKQVRLNDVSQQAMLAFLQRLVGNLLHNGKTLTDLIRHKFSLARAVSERLNDYRKQAQTKCYQQCLFDGNDELQFCLDKQYQFQFEPAYYAPQPPYYSGKYKFQKHYFAHIEDLKASGEEFECAMAIDSLPQVKFWVRNPVHRGFALPLAHQNFYPDFIVQLNDERILLVEYKGEQLKSNDDSKEKRLIGEHWENLSKGQCLFLMAVKQNEKGQDVRTQLVQKIEN